VETVAGGAVGHPDLAELCRRPVEALGIGFEAGSQEAVLPAQGDVVVAAGADLGHLCRVDPGIDVLGREDGVLVVAVRTDGNILDALDEILAVDALQIVPLYPHMAGAAGLDDVLAGDERQRIADTLDLMGAVAVAAVGRHRQPGFL